MNTYDYLERLCTLLRAGVRTAGTQVGLQPIHVQTLRYLALCNRYSDSPMALTEFLGQTKGTVSQSVKLLEAKGLVSKDADIGDRRVVHLGLTDRGAAVLRDLGADQGLEVMMAPLEDADRANLNEALERLLRVMQRANDFKTFGPCGTCRFNQSVSNGSRCGLTGDLLSDTDLSRICREHAYPEKDGAS